MLKNLACAAAAILSVGLAVTTYPPMADAAGARTTPHATRQLCGKAPRPGINTCFAVAQTTPVQPAATPNAVRPFATPGGYGPSDLQAAYSLPSGSAGAGQLVAIIDAYGAPNLESDLATYRAQYGLPDCTTSNGCFHKLNQDGQASPLPAGDTGWAGETSLDVDMVSAICPLCKIDVLEANSAGGDLNTAINTAVSLGAKFISLSWGSGEYASETSQDSSTYSHPGVAITASSGDGGYGVSYPAASPGVVAVGGTTLSRASNARGWTESAWSGAGSGCSAYEPKPAFQHDSGCGRRTVADVSAVADPQTGVAYYDTYGSGGWGIVGGTSVAAPIIASVYALAGAPSTSASANSYPYVNSGSLWDAVGGSNGSCGGSYLCTGVTGYDGPTGLGTPHAVAAFSSGGAAARATGAVRSGLAGKCADVNGGNSVNGTAVQVWDCNGSSAQLWTQYSDGTLRAVGKCLDANAFGTANGTKLQLWDCTAGSNQQWQAYNGGYRNPTSGRCMDDPNSSTVNGTQLQLWDCNGSSAQIWSTPGGNPAGGTGGGTVSATATIQAEGFNAQSGTVAEATTDTGGGQDVGSIGNGDWVQYNNVDFGAGGLHTVSVRCASGAAAGVSGIVEVHLDSLSNAAVGSFSVGNTGGWQNWTTIPGSVGTITGTHTVFLKFVTGSGQDFVNVNWFSFS